MFPKDSNKELVILEVLVIDEVEDKVFFLLAETILFDILGLPFHL